MNMKFTMQLLHFPIIFFSSAPQEIRNRLAETHFLGEDFGGAFIDATLHHLFSPLPPPRLD